MNGIKEQLQRDIQSGKVKMILGIVFLALSTVFSVVAPILKLVQNLLLHEINKIVGLNTVINVLVILMYLAAFGFSAAGTPLLIIGIVTRVKSKNRLKALEAEEADAARIAPTPTNDQKEAQSIVADSAPVATNDIYDLSEKK